MQDEPQDGLSAALATSSIGWRSKHDREPDSSLTDVVPAEEPEDGLNADLAASSIGWRSEQR